MAKPNNIYQILFLLFLLISFLVGGYVYSTMDIKYMIAKSEGMAEGPKIVLQDPATVQSNTNKKTDTPELCPDLLIQRGPIFLLYNTKMPMVQGKNPLSFNSLDEYSAHFKSLNSTGKSCPPLFLQQENNAQGTDVYRIRPSPFNPFAGVPSDSALVRAYDGKVMDDLDASRDNGYNQNMYPGFDPDNLFIGRITALDKVHESTENVKMSDNPMDSNWGGVLYTQAQVDSGKYIENTVTSTNYVTPKGAQNLPFYGPPNPYP
jgi:hypothetical protein